MTPNDEMLLRHGITGRAEGFANHFVGVEVNLPVMIVVAVGTHGEHRTVEIEFKNFHVRRRVRQNVGDFSDPAL